MGEAGCEDTETKTPGSTDLLQRSVDLSKADILAGEMLASLTAGFQAGRCNGVGCWTADHKIARQSRVAYRRLDYEDRVTGRSLGDTG